MAALHAASDPTRFAAQEALYLAFCPHERRLLDVAAVRALPHVPAGSPHAGLLPCGPGR